MRQQIVEVLHFSVEVEVEGQVSVVSQIIDLGKDIEVRQVHLQHAAQREEQRGHVQRRSRKHNGVGQVHDYQLGTSAKIDEVAGGEWYSVPKLLEAEEDVPQRSVMREELDLAGAVEQDVVIYPVSAFASSNVSQAD